MTVPSVLLLVMTDGRRDCIAQTITSATLNVPYPWIRRVIHDDSGDPLHRQWLAETFGPLGFQVAFHPGGRQGFGGAIRNAWRMVAADPCHPDFVFHLEDDFVFNRRLDVAAMAEVLDAHPYLIQLALRRQPWNDEERAAGGIVEQHPGDFAEMRWEGHPHVWLEHRRFFTTNPSLYRADLCRRSEWPTGSNSEGHFTHRILEHAHARFGYWGARDSGEAVEHIGHTRVGVGY